MAKIGRNEKCPCNSGKKFKHCHGSITAKSSSLKLIPNEQLDLMVKRAEAQISAIEKQQGLGKKIVSDVIGNYRVLAVKNKIHYFEKNKTFHDFLIKYIASAVGEEWGNQELKKPFEERHQIIQWYQYVCEHQKTTIKEEGKVSTGAMIGAVESYLNLAYNLYNIEHNKELQNRLIKRLKNPDQFPGAYYETFVFSYLMKAGFDVEFEDESGSLPGKKVECIVTHRISGKKYSVEAKSINRIDVLGATRSGTNKKLKASIRDQLNSAFKKDSNDPRIIFVEVNIACKNPVKGQEPEWFTDARLAVKEREETLGQGKSAYVILTNHPSHHSVHLKNSNYARSVIPLGCAIKDFGNGVKFLSLKDYYYAKKSHQDVYDLITSIDEHYNIPSTFDGTHPEFTFGNIQQPRLLIGERYLIPDESGTVISGILEDAIVDENKREVIGIYKTDSDNRRIIVKGPISEDELIAYRRNPEIFFGIKKHVGKHLAEDDAVGLFEFFLETYIKTPKAKLLEFMENSSDLDNLRKLDQEELAVTYCERMVAAMMAKNKTGDK